MKAVLFGTVMTGVLTGTLSYLASAILLAGSSTFIGEPSAVHLALITLGFSLSAGWAFGLVLHARGARFKNLAVTAFLVSLGLGCFWAWSTRTPSAETDDWLLAMWVLASLATLVLFAAVRAGAAALLLVQVAWIAFAAISMRVAEEKFSAEASDGKVVLAR
jgi:hypothetical protein